MRNQKSILVLAMITAFITTGLFLSGLIVAGDLEPPGPPGPTMKTLDQTPPIWSQIIPGSERFELVMNNEAVLDKETGLVWARNADLDWKRKWLGAINYCGNLTLCDRKGWRLPTREELTSLLDMSISGAPKLSSGHPFVNVQSDYYWSSTENKGDSTYACCVRMTNGLVSIVGNKDYDYYMWPVRGGN